MYESQLQGQGLAGINQSVNAPEPTHAQKIMDLQNRIANLEKTVSELVSHMIGTVGANLKL